MAPAGATGWSWAPSLQHKHQGPFRTEYVDSLGRIWLCHLPAVLASDFTSLSLRILTWQMGILTVPSSESHYVQCVR